MGFCRQYWLPAFLLILLTSLLPGCGGGNTPGPDLGEEAPPADDGPVAGDTAPPAAGELTTLGELAGTADKLSSAATVYPGDELARSTGVTKSGGVLKIQSAPGGMAWAIWGWRNLDYGMNYPVGLELELDNPSGKYYIGVPDFSQKSWRFCGPYTGLALQIYTTEVSPLRASLEGVSYLAVLCYDGAGVRLKSLELKTGQFLRDGAPPLVWCATRYYEGSSYNYIYLDWDRQRYSFYRYEVERWEVGQDPADAVVFTDYQDLGSHRESGRIRYGYFRDAQVVPGRYYQYRVTGVEQNGKRSRPGPVTLGYAGPQDAELALRGRVMYDEYFVAPGIGLYLPEVELYASTDDEGRYCFPGLDPGAYNVWIVSPLGSQHGVLVPLTDPGTSVPDIMLEYETMPDYNWHWLYPPRQVSAERTGQRTVELSWSEPTYADAYRVFRCYELEPNDLMEVYSGAETSVTLYEEPSGALEYYVQAVEFDVSYNRRYSPLSLPARVTIPFSGVAPDSIYAIPEKTSAYPGERVRVTVYTNEAAHPLQFMNGCRITYETGNTIPRETFNVGAPGGPQFDPDGVWAQTNPGGGIFAVPMDLIREEEIGHGRKCCTFNVTTVGGSDVNLATGALFNFEIEVYTDVHFSFVATAGVRRTYYSDGASNEYLWRDYYNYGQPWIELVEE